MPELPKLTPKCSSSSSLDPTQTLSGALPKTLPDFLSSSQKCLKNISQNPGDPNKTCQHHSPTMPPSHPPQSGAQVCLGRGGQGGHWDAHSPVVLAVPAVPPTVPPSCQALLDAQALPELPQRNWALSQACAPYQRLCPPKGAPHACAQLSTRLCHYRLQECREWAPASPQILPERETLQ